MSWRLLALSARKEPTSPRPTLWITLTGFCIFNDWSCRDLQRDESAVGLGPAKAERHSASSIGPCLVTTDELAPYLKDGRLQSQMLGPG